MLGLPRSFDIDTDAPSHLQHRTPESILDSGALEKKKLYKMAMEDRRGTCTLLMGFSTERLHEHCLKHVATSIAAKWDKSYAETCALSELDFYLPWFEHQACV